MLLTSNVLTNQSGFPGQSGIPPLSGDIPSLLRWPGLWTNIIEYEFSPMITVTDDEGVTKPPISIQFSNIPPFIECVQLSSTFSLFRKLTETFDEQFRYVDFSENVHGDLVEYQNPPSNSQHLSIVSWKYPEVKKIDWTYLMTVVTIDENQTFEIQQSFNWNAPIGLDRFQDEVTKSKW